MSSVLPPRRNIFSPWWRVRWAGWLCVLSHPTLPVLLYKKSTQKESTHNNISFDSHVHFMQFNKQKNEPAQLTHFFLSFSKAVFAFLCACLFRWLISLHGSQFSGLKTPVRSARRKRVQRHHCHHSAHPSPSSVPDLFLWDTVSLSPLVQGSCSMYHPEREALQR